MRTENFHPDNLVLGGKSLKKLYDEIKGLYKSDSRPWVLGYSGGKDSTAALQLIWYAISELPVGQRTKPIYVISSDTLVETPIIKDFISKNHEKINKKAVEKNLPFRAYKLEPIIKDTFWVNLLGKGYPAPSSRFRWCTERLKIRNADRFILNRVTEFGEVITVLGVRKGESATRDQVISLYKIEGSILSRHSRFPGAFVYTPIVDFSVDDVWEYLMTLPSPWGSDNEELFKLYKDANAGECPLVIDKTTPSCGNSRFGCWVCTVVAKDKAMESLVGGEEKWMKPLLDFRNLLAYTQNPEKKPIFREAKRRHGNIDFKHKNTTVNISYGPYKMIFRRGFLRRLLKIQEQLRRENPDKNITLIKPDELHEIRKIWQLEGRNSGDPIPRIYREITGKSLKWVQEDVGAFGIEDEDLLNQICKSKDMPFELVYKMLEVERQTQGMSRRSSIFNRLDLILGEEWRTIEEVIEEQREVLKQKELRNYI